MLYFLSILLTEVKLLGVPIRTPVLLFVPRNRRNLILLSVLLPLPLLGFYALSVTESFEKSNLLLLSLILLGFLYVSLSDISATYAVVKRSVVGCIGVLLFVCVLQKFDLFVLADYFKIDPGSIGRRSYGLSAEPSFFGVMFAYFLIVAHAFRVIDNFKLICLFLAGLALSEALTLIEFATAYFLALAIARSSWGGKRLFDSRFLLPLMILVYFLLDEAFRLFTGEGYGEYFLLNHQSWRQFSNLSVLHGASLFRFPSLGEGWVSQIIQGQIEYSGAVREWLRWPWSLFAMLSLEIGIVPASCLVGSVYFYRIKKIEVDTHRTVYSVLFFMGLFYTPKWAIYLFFFPFISERKSSKKMHRLRPSQINKV